MKKEATGKSHAKIILIGEHSVVYGQPAIALPIDSIPITVTTNQIERGLKINSEFFRGNIKEAPVYLLGIKRLIEAVLSDLGHLNAPLQINFASEIPSERGMGSSAAVATALIKSLYHFFEVPLDRATLLHLSEIEETITHGNPSGIDTATVSSNSPIWFVHDQEPDPIELSLSGYLVIADSGVRGQTDVAVNSVRQITKKSKRARHAIVELGRLTSQTRVALETNDIATLGALMNAAQAELNHLDINIPKTARLINVANQNGALGTKITGSGLGGCIIALASDRTSAINIATALGDAGAVNTWIETF